MMNQTGGRGGTCGGLLSAVATSRSGQAVWQWWCGNGPAAVVRVESVRAVAAGGDRRRRVMSDEVMTQSSDDPRKKKKKLDFFLGIFHQFKKTKCLF